MTSASIAGTPYNRTTWRVINSGMNELIDSGWKVISHSSHRVVILPGTNSGKDEVGYTYILSKGNKLIQCVIYDPQPDDAYSRCRYLN
jgi:hypothetical protein